MLKTLVMDFIAFKPEFSRRLSRIFFSASSRLSRNFRGRVAGLAQIAAGGRLSRRLIRDYSRGRGQPYISFLSSSFDHRYVLSFRGVNPGGGSLPPIFWAGGRWDRKRGRGGHGRVVKY